MPCQEDDKFNSLATTVAALSPSGVIKRTLYVGRMHEGIIKILPGQEMTCCGVQGDEPYERPQDFRPQLQVLRTPFLGLRPESGDGYDMIFLYCALDHPHLCCAFSHVQRIVEPLLKSAGWLISCHDAGMRRRFAYTLVDMAAISCGGKDWRIEVSRK